MATTTVFSLAALLALVAADPGFLAVPVTRAPAPTNSTQAKLVSKYGKVGYIPEVLKNLVFQYEASFELGDGQQQTASIDTGSSDLWVYSTSSGAPNGFDPSGSQYVNSGFEIQYVDGSGATGNYYKDYLTWGGSKANVQFAVSDEYSGNPPNGVFGIGLELSEASQDGLYANYPAALKQQGLIEANAYSLYLDNVNADHGTLLFGAVDTSRFQGQLKTIPLTSIASFNVDFEVAGYKLNGVLDSGTSLTYLPDDVVAEIAQGLGATWNSQAQAWQATGDVSGTSVTYSFAGKQVTVPASELWLDLAGEGQGTYLTIYPNSQASGYTLLGDTFLRSAYVVYDLDNRQIAIAQANLNGGSPNYEVITPNGIPGAA